MMARMSDIGANAHAAGSSMGSKFIQHMPQTLPHMPNMPDLAAWQASYQSSKPIVHGAITIMTCKDGKIEMDPTPLCTSLSSSTAMLALEKRTRGRSASFGTDDGKRRSYGNTLREVADSARLELRHKLMDILGEEEDEPVPDIRPYRLYNFDELPEWLQDNPFILTGYQCYTTYRESWKGMFRWHNETSTSLIEVTNSKL